MKANKKQLCIIFCIAFLIMSYMMNGVYYIGHDTIFHSSSIIDLVNRISLKNLIPSRISSIVGYGFGYGTSLFYPPFPHLLAAYIAKLISFITPNVYFSMKIVHFITVFLSGVTSYFLSLKIFKNKNIALTSSIIYMFFPYHLSEIYIRDSFCESWIFVFLPLIICGIYELIDGNYFKFLILFVFGYTLAMYCHLVSMVYFTILLIPIFLIYFNDIFSKKNILYLCLAVILILCLTSPYTMPMLEHKINGSYTVFLEGAMSSKVSIAKSTLSIADYFIQKGSSSYSGIKFFINIVVILLLSVTLYNYKNINLNSSESKKIKSLLSVLILNIIFMSSLIPWMKLPSQLTIIQFIWRLEIMLILIISLVAPLCIKVVQKSKQNLCTFIILMTIILFGIGDISFYSSEITNYKTDNVKDWGLGYEKEYLPTKTSIDYLLEREKNPGILLLDGSASIDILENNVPYLKFSVKDLNQISSIELPRIYYLGYELKDENNKSIKLQESENGFLQANIKNEGIYKLNYVGTKIMKMANILFMISLVSSIIYILCYLRFMKNRR